MSNSVLSPPTQASELFPGSSNVPVSGEQIGQAPHVFRTLEVRQLSDWRETRKRSTASVVVRERVFLCTTGNGYIETNLFVRPLGYQRIFHEFAMGGGRGVGVARPDAKGHISSLYSGVPHFQALPNNWKRLRCRLPYPLSCANPAPDLRRSSGSPGLVFDTS